MNWLLERKLKKIGRSASPRRAYVGALQKTLQAEMGHPVRWIDWKNVTVATLTSLSLIVGGTGVYAYSSDEVTPDHPLYSLRQEIESVEEEAAVTPELKQHVQQNHQQRREHERQVMEERRKAQEERKDDEHRESRRGTHDERLSDREDR